jgi:hypothetical protein
MNGNYITHIEIYFYKHVDDDKPYKCKYYGHYSSRRYVTRNSAGLKLEPRRREGMSQEIREELAELDDAPKAVILFFEDHGLKIRME